MSGATAHAASGFSDREEPGGAYSGGSLGYDAVQTRRAGRWRKPVDEREHHQERRARNEYLRQQRQTLIRKLQQLRFDLADHLAQLEELRVALSGSQGGSEQLRADLRCQNQALQQRLRELRAEYTALEALEQETELGPEPS
jgi:uncharacterized coiled-coil DUF342 family protein